MEKSYENTTNKNSKISSIITLQAKCIYNGYDSNKEEGKSNKSYCLCFRKKKKENTKNSEKI